jgi:hypothetical protein
LARAVGSFLGRNFQEKNRENARLVWKIPRMQRLILFGGKMTWFSRSFIRKRVISLATTMSVAAVSLALAQGSTSAYHLRGAVPIQYVADHPDYSEEQPFLSENDAAMNKMMADMTVKPTGDVDRDFVAMMTPHHQGAIEMAQSVLRSGRNEQIRRLAQEVIVTQQQEIAAMRLAIGDSLPPSIPSPTEVSRTSSSIMPSILTSWFQKAGEPQ